MKDNHSAAVRSGCHAGALAKADCIKHVYMIQSELHSDRYYVGCTADLKQRFDQHNRGESPHTKKYAPWKLVGYLAFSDHAKAEKFEIYLKTASGRVFAKKHF
jgi:putative endonuclease